MHGCTLVPEHTVIELFCLRVSCKVECPAQEEESGKQTKQSLGEHSHLHNTSTHARTQVKCTIPIEHEIVLVPGRDNAKETGSKALEECQTTLCLK